MSANRLLDQLESPFFIGCNYWASHAGTAMWSDWKPDIVESDLKKLASEGIEVLRVFPLWPDFQPIERTYREFGNHSSYRFGEEHFPDTDAGQAGVSEVMMQRFEAFAALSGKYGIKLIVGLITGWMSGRLFVPPALRGKSIITDADSIRWQVKFVSYFVSRMKSDAAIIAWDLGNECNSMGKVESREQAFVWTASLSGAIKRADAGRPLISGMHCLFPNGNWTMQDQGELTDILTTHPYPYWTPYMDYEPMDTMRATLHATAESLFYAGIGGKPCFAEEMGTMGPMVCSDEVAVAFARASMLAQWAHGLHGLQWWCANDQTKLKHAPYDEVACESELGLLTKDGRVKPVLTEMAKLKQDIAAFPIKELPPRRSEAVCILNSDQDHWAVAYGSFMLSKQAGFDLTFRFEDQPLPDAELYLLPCVTGVRGMPKRRWEQLLQRVQEGASLYVSVDDGYMLQFSELTGLSVLNRQRRTQPAQVLLGSIEDQISVPSSFRWTFGSVRAEVLATEEDGNPVLTRAAYGKGTVYFMSLPVELAITQGKETCSKPGENPYWKIYRAISREAVGGRVLSKEDPLVGVTEHPVTDGKRVAVLINHTPEVKSIRVRLADGWQLEDCWRGQAEDDGEQIIVRLAANDGAVILLKPR
ncbi:glycoside hydrolase 5 family protein [Paenibacillus lignilyticus]|uniref:Cellulase family glycosylhydrolase n=1 Tax=Paenibacillus lignilyticus TaxID=1172615 RepID=A0ABS5C7B5_9BACL|nr:cellulase family glycosylhydrolase [Paenibacillus lignilyticus]MBP3961889.1 cellulase family glycosylhydrolase [Paenibacillus lignilyticus]